MEKSIESIWTEGFLDSDELKAPKINDLYNRKSELVIEKIKKTYTIDMKLGIILVALFVIGFSYFSLYITVIYTSMAFICLFIYNKYIIKSLEGINITTNSYDFLITYRNEFRKSIKKSALLLGTIFPLVLILGYYISYYEAGILTKVIKMFGSLNTVSILLISYISLSVLMLCIYFLSIKLMYGTSLKKIDDIIKDMEELNT